MTSIIALEKFQEIIRQDPNNIIFCERELDWIENRIHDWSSDRIRVGVIGVTSSGKSTLINAVLGTDILSSAIAPSSGQLVCCSYGEKPEITIRFENGTEQKFSGKQFGRDILQEFSDERYNPQNQKGVLNIELTSPLFDFGKDVLLVDSPGLDAFGLEAHERLALECLVPTMDACIYVTTMKTNSDQKTLEILNTVAKYQCPIIIVQNMLDAVRPSPSGDKTREQVATDHRNRVKRIVDRSDIEDKDSVQIIQISAELAKKWKSAKSAGTEPPITEDAYHKSNYELFVDSVTRILEVQRPRIERQRLHSIQSRVDALSKSIQERINEPTAAIEETFPLQGLKSEVENRRAFVPLKYQEILGTYTAAAKRIRVAVGVEKADGRNIEHILNDANRVVKKFEEYLANIISEHNEFIRSVEKVINIPSRDLLCSSTFHTFKSVALEKTIQIEHQRVEKEGFWGKVARRVGDKLKGIFDNDWGYENESREIVVTDVKATKRKISFRLTEAYKRYTKTMEDWEKRNFNRSMDLIEAEIEASEKSYQRKKSAAVEAQSLAKLENELKIFIEQLRKDLPDSELTKYEEKNSTPSSSKKVDVTPYVGTVLQLSRFALQQQQRAIAHSFISAIACENHVPILISWDDHCSNDFMWQTGISDAVVIRSPVSNAAIPQEPNRCFFVLVNAIQYGAAHKQIDALHLNSVLNEQDHVVWVIQDFQELLTSDRAVEGLSEIAKLSGVLRIPCKSSLFIMHENPVYNLVLLKLQFNPFFKYAPHKLIYEIQAGFGVYLTDSVSETLGEIVNKVHLRTEEATHHDI